MVVSDALREQHEVPHAGSRAQVRVVREHLVTRLEEGVQRALGGVGAEAREERVGQVLIVRGPPASASAQSTAESPPPAMTTR